MNNKQKSWREIQLAIATVALTATLGFWNLFSAGQKQQVVAAPSATDTETPPTQELAQVPAPTSTPKFLPVKIIFGGAAPKQKVVVQVNAPQAQPKHKNNGGGGNSGNSGGGGGTTAPQPPVSTGTSKP